MAIQVEFWQKDIIETLWADNTFLQHAVNADQYVVGGKVVHIPQAGAAPGVERNRTVLPAVVKRRIDTDVTYALNELTSDPYHIPNADTVELSYDKRRSVTEEMRGNIADSAALDMLFNWAPKLAGSIIRTTGAAVPAHLPSAIGNRKSFVYVDLQTAASLMNQKNVPSADRFAMVDAIMYDQLIKSFNANEQRDFLRYADLANNILGRFAGFNIMMRSKTLKYDNDSTLVSPIDWSIAGAETDNAAVLCWQKNSVERALGDVKMFENLNDPTYYGDIYSALLRIGGRIRRQDEAGVVAIVQAASA